MKTILLKLNAPLQSYGIEPSYKDFFTKSFPSKSAIIGLLGAALGYHRDDDKNIQKLSQLNFGVRIDQTGNLMMDYQIAQQGQKQAQVYQKYYLNDACFIVGLQGEDVFIDQIYQALKKPKFTLYLGRKCNPINWDFLLGVFDESLVTLLSNFDWQAAHWFKKDCKIYKAPIYFDYDVLQTAGTIQNDLPVSFTVKKTDNTEYDRRTYRPHQYAKPIYIKLK